MNIIVEILQIRSYTEILANDSIDTTDQYMLLLYSQ